MWNRRLLTVVLGYGLGLGSSAMAQVPSVVAGELITAAGIQHFGKRLVAHLCAYLACR